MQRDAKASQPRPPSAIVRAWRLARQKTDRYRFLSDVVGAIVIVLFVLGLLSAATGGVWPPMVVIESGSMMHSTFETPYGRWGTIDVGDVLFLRATSPDKLHTWAEGGGERYGRPGDVIAYAPDGNRDPTTNTTIIHRAIAYVAVDHNAPGGIVYRVEWIDGTTKDFGPEGIYLPALGFHEPNGFSPAAGYRPPYSGYLTKGDNAFTNPAVDQAIGISRLVDPSWIVGEVYGEIPWIGLGKLALQSGKTNPEVPGWNRVGNAFAPTELWSMFFLVVALVVIVPLTVDTWRALGRHRAERRRERQALAAERHRRRQVVVPVDAGPAATPPRPIRRTTTLQVVSKSPPPPRP